MSRLRSEVTATDEATAWQVVLRNPSGKVVLYNEQQRALRVRAGSPTAEESHEPDVIDAATSDVCPLCGHPFVSAADVHAPPVATSARRRLSSRISALQSTRYFGLLSESHANTPASSRPATPPPFGSSSPFVGDAGPSILADDLATGFFARFFRVEAVLGRGQRGCVYLCRHVLHGNELSLYACKKVSVGDSAASLVATLKEIRHLASLRHPHVVAYHHAWLEASSVGRTAPIVPCLFILQDFANGGNLEHFIQGRMGLSPLEDGDSKEIRIQRFKAQRDGTPSPSARGAIHFLRVDEILRLFRDITEGLSFMHSHNILHLDLKTENVLLDYEPENLLPRAMLSDFGSAEDRPSVWRRNRSGATGTLDFVCPEAIRVDADTGLLRELSAEADLWALGLILHQLCFFRLPYRQRNDVDLLREEIQSYKGFDPKQEHGRRDLPVWLLRLLSRLLSIDPAARPSAAAVLAHLDQCADGDDNKEAERGMLVPARSVKGQWNVRHSGGPEVLRHELMPTPWIFALVVLAKLILLRPAHLVLLYAYFTVGLVETASCATS